MNTRITFLLATLLSLNVFSADYYKCKVEKAYEVDSSGVLKDSWIKGADFTIDRVTGEYRSGGGIIRRDLQFKVIDKGDKDTHFRAFKEPGFNDWSSILLVREFADSKKKPFVIMMANRAAVSSGLCEKF